MTTRNFERADHDRQPGDLKAYQLDSYMVEVDGQSRMYFTTRAQAIACRAELRRAYGVLAKHFPSYQCRNVEAYAIPAGSVYPYTNAKQL